MATENATTIAGLSTSNPAGTGPKSQGDDHIRMLKNVLQNTFPQQGRALNNFQTKTALTTISAEDNNTTFVTSGTWVLYGPANAGLPPPNGFCFEVDNSAGAGVITFTPQNGQEVDDAPSFDINAGKRYRFVSDGANWWSDEYGVDFDTLRAPLKNCFAANRLSLITVTGTTKLTFQTELADPDSVFDGPNSKFETPVTGIYLFFLTAQWVEWSANTPLALHLYKNGSFNAAFNLTRHSTTNEIGTDLAMYAVSLAAGDYIEFYTSNLGALSVSFYNLYLAGWRMS